MNPKRLIGRVGVLSAAFLAFCAGQASAASYGPNFCLNDGGTDCQVQLDLGSAGLASSPGPYVSGDISIVSNKTLRFSFTSDTQLVDGTAHQYLFNHLAFYLADAAEISDASFVSASVDGAGHAIGNGDVMFRGALPEGAFSTGLFGTTSVSVRYCAVQGRGCDWGYYGAVSQLTFDLTWSADSAVDWTDLHQDQVLLLNGDGALFGDGGQSAAGYIYVGGGEQQDTSIGFHDRGVAAWPNCSDQNVARCSPVPAPEPATLLLLLPGLVGVALSRRRPADAAVAEFLSHRY